MNDQERDHDTSASCSVPLGIGDLRASRPDQKTILIKRALPSPTALLFSCVLARTLGPRLMVRLKSPNRPVLICLQVPDKSWFDPLREAARSMLRVPAVHSWDSTARRPSGDPSVGEVVLQVTSGQAVLCVSQDVATVVPRAIRTVADAVVSLSAPEAADIALAISLVRDGRPPSRVPVDLGRGLDLYEVAACLRQDEAPRVMVERIRKAMKSKTGSDVDLTAPRLEDLHGYGSAATWGMRVVSDVNDFRAGRVTWSDVAGPAVLHGPPGTGKTLFARALARSLGAPIVATSVSAWFRSLGSGDLGATVRNASAAFDEARALVRNGGVAVLFVDEVNGLPDRSALAPNQASWWRPVVNHVLTLVDGSTSDLERIVLLAATNDLRAVDPALLRPGRFGTALEVLPPSVEDLAGVVRHHLGGTACPIAKSDLAAVLRPLAGATQARAAAWAMEASRSARAAGRPVRLDDLVAVALPAERHSAIQRRRIAVHEGGHAVAAYHLARARLVSVSIVETDAMHGSTSMVLQEHSLLDREEIETEVVLALSGRAADVVVGSGANAGAGGSGYGATSSDLAIATRLLTDVHASYGLGSTLRHRAATAGAPDGKIERLVEADLRRLMARAEDLIKAHAAEVRALVDALLERRFLSAAEVGAVISTMDRPTPTGDT